MFAAVQAGALGYLLKGIFTKLDVDNRAAAIVRAREAGLGVPR
ncbi:MAG: hypothetical protein ACXWXO_10795 [Nocardioides sp.]